MSAIDDIPAVQLASPCIINSVVGLFTAMGETCVCFVDLRRWDL